MKKRAKARGDSPNGALVEGKPLGGERQGGRMSDIEHPRQIAGSQAHDTELQLGRTAELEALLREAIIWCPRVPKHPTSAKRQAVGDGWVDLGDRIEAELAGNVAKSS
jgi:hypothetical protein